jgi:hypothetical protein
VVGSTRGFLLTNGRQITTANQELLLTLVVLGLGDGASSYMREPSPLWLEIYPWSPSFSKTFTNSCSKVVPCSPAICSNALLDLRSIYIIKLISTYASTDATSLALTTVLVLLMVAAAATLATFEVRVGSEGKPLLKSCAKVVPLKKASALIRLLLRLQIKKEFLNRSLSPLLF